MIEETDDCNGCKAAPITEETAVVTTAKMKLRPVLRAQIRCKPTVEWYKMPVT